MEEIPAMIFLGKGVEKLKGFTTAYLIIISAMLAHVLLNEAYRFYLDSNVELTLSSVITFVLSPQGALFIAVYAVIVGCHYILLPLLIKPVLYLIRGSLFLGGNLVFYFIYLTLTKVFRLEAERRFSFIGEDGLLNHALCLFRICRYKNERILKGRFFGFYQWYVLNVLPPTKRTAYNVYLTTSILISTWVVVHWFKFFELAPVVYYAMMSISLTYMVNTIVVSWVVKKPDYFLGVAANTISYADSLNLQPKSR